MRPEYTARGAALLARAFHDDPLMVHLAPDPAHRRRALPHTMGATQAYCLRYGRVTTNADLDGVACWMEPGKTFPTYPRLARSGVLATLPRLGVAGLRRMMSVAMDMDRGHHRAMPDPHWYLCLLATEPDRRGRGIAAALMQPTLDEADATGLPCYLDTHLERNIGYYARHGFEPVLDDVADGVPYWGLRREPR